MAYTPIAYVGQDIWINDLSLNGIDDNDCIWAITDLDGWWGLPDVDSSTDPRPYTEDGSYRPINRYTGRNITVTGTITPNYGRDDPTARPEVQARDSLNLRLNLVRTLGTFRVDEVPSKIVSVQLMSQPKVVFDKINNVLKFSFQLRAVDPRKYAANTTALIWPFPTDNSGLRFYDKKFMYSYNQSNGVDPLIVVNGGTYPTNGIFTIRGPVSRPMITHLGLNKSIQLNVTLTEADYIELDLRTKDVKFNGLSNYKYTETRTSNWFNIEPGINEIAFSGVYSYPVDYGSDEVTNLAFQPVPAPATLGWSSDIYSIPDGDWNVVYRASGYGRRPDSAAMEVTIKPTSAFYFDQAASNIYSALTNIGSDGVTRIPIDESTDYTFSVYVKSDAPGILSTNLYVNFYDATGTQIGSKNLQNMSNYADAGSGWLRLHGTTMSPVGSASCVVYANTESRYKGGASTFKTWYTDAMVTKGSTLYTYFDSTFDRVSVSPTQPYPSVRETTLDFPLGVVEFRYRSAWIE